MQLELKNPEGKVIGVIEFPVEELSQSLNQSLSDFSKSSEAQLKDQVTDILKNKETEVAKLNDQIVALSEQVVTLQSPETKAKWLEEFLTPKNFVVVATRLGYTLPEATKAEVKEGDELEELEKSHIIYDPAVPKDKENWKHLDNLGCWVPKES